MPGVRFPASSGELDGYLAEPVGAGPWPAVVVIHDSLGLRDHIRAHADRLAAAGYLALVPALYSAGGPRCVVSTISSSRSGRGRAYPDIDAARRWLADRDDCTGRIAIIGFCMGGGFAVLSAPRFPFAAAAVNYGEVPSDAERDLAGACPIVASYGARDRTLRGRAQRLERALEALDIPHDVEEYPDAGHSFMDRINLGPAGTPLLRFVGFDYHHPSAEDAWRRILAFFAEHLAEPEPA